MKKKPYDKSHVTELLYQALETELGGEKVYERALAAVMDEDLEEEWQKYLEETRNHQKVLLEVFEECGLDPATDTPGRGIVRHHGKSLVDAIDKAISNGNKEAAQLVAGECVVLAETKDHQNWELIGHLTEHSEGPWIEALKTAFDQVEKEEDHHLYHTKGWIRELWIRDLGLPAALPPPEEVKKVETAIGAARAEKARDQHLGRH